MERFKCVLFVFNLIGCSRYKAPEGVRQFFYDDMKCIKLAEKTLETKNKKYISEIAELIKKHSADNIFEIIYFLNTPFGVFFLFYMERSENN